MSHVSRIELEIKSLEDLKKACKRLGLRFLENQKTYKWYGTWVGDHPLPEGISEKDLGKCDHAIKVPGAHYQIGLVKRDNRYQLLWDSWSAGGLEKVLGKNAGMLKQAYAVEAVNRASRLAGLKLRENRNKGFIRLKLTA